MRVLLLLVLCLPALAGSSMTIRNSSNSTVGKIESNGTIRNSSNSTLGRIESDGTIRVGGNVWGSAQGGDPHKVAAVLYFFSSDFLK